MKKIGYVIPIFPTLSEAFVGVEIRTMIALGHGFVEKTGLNTLIKAFSQLPPDASLDIVGDGPLLAQLQQQAHLQGVASQIHFLDRKEAMWYRQQANDYKAFNHVMAQFTALSQAKRLSVQVGTL